MKQFEDRLAKYLAGNLFQEHTLVEVGADLLPDTFRADVLLIPETPLPDIPGAGLFTRMTQEARCLIEPFSSAVHPERLEANLVKLKLAIFRAHSDKIGRAYPKGVLWLIATYFPQKAVERVFQEPGEELEPGLLKWGHSPRETIFLVHTNALELRDDTLMFFLFGKEKRQDAVRKIFTEELEPYVTLLNQFDMRFQQMAENNPFSQIDPEEFRNLVDLRNTRAEVLRELGREEGRKEGREEGREEARQELAKKMLGLGEPPEKICTLTGLSLEELQALT